MPPIVFEIQANAKKAIAEFEKMNAEMRKLDTQSRKTSKSMDEIDKSSKALTNSFSKLAKIGILSVTTGLTAMGYAGIKAALSNEKAFAFLENSVRNTGQNFKAALPQITAVSDALVDLGFHDEETAMGMAKLTAATGNVKTAIKSMNVAADLARFKQISLTDASELLARATTGQAKGLRDLGIAMGISMEKGSSYEQILAAINKRIGGTAEAFGQTAGGKLAIFNAKLDQLKEKVGYALLPALIDLTDWLNKTGLPALEKMFKWFDKNKEAIKLLVAALGGLYIGNRVVKGFDLIAKGAMGMKGAFDLLRGSLVGVKGASMGLKGAGIVGMLLSVHQGLTWVHEKFFDKSSKSKSSSSDRDSHAAAMLGGDIGAGIDYKYGDNKSADALITANQAIKDSKDKAVLAASEIKSAWVELVGKDVKKAIAEGLAEPVQGLINKITEARNAYTESTSAIGAATDRLSKKQAAYVAAIKSGNKAAIASTESAMKAAQKVLDDLQASASKAIQDLASIQTQMIEKVVSLTNEMNQLNEDRVKAETQANTDIEEETQKYYKARKDLYEQYNLDVKNAEAQAAKERNSIIKSSIDQLRGIFKSATDKSIGDIFDALTFQGRYIAGGTSNNLIDALKTQLDKTKVLAEDASALAGKGFSQTFIEQVVAQGPELGHQLAESILTASPESILELKKMWEELQRVSSHGVDTIANSLNTGITLATEQLTEQLAQVGLDLTITLGALQMQLNKDLSDSLIAFNSSVGKIRDGLAVVVANINTQILTIKNSIALLNEQLAILSRLSSPTGAPAPTTPTTPTYTTPGGITTPWDTGAGTKAPAGPIGDINNPQMKYTDAQIAADMKVPATLNQQAYQMQVTAERWQAQADAYFKANPNLDPLTGQVRMATGGIVTRATSAIVGEAGPEAVIPLDKLEKLMGGSGGKGVNVTINATTNATAQSIASDVGWAIRTSSDVNYASTGTYDR
jgi:hypothetical protein